MACFLVPMGEAVVTTVVQRVVARREKRMGGEGVKSTGLSWSRKLGWLNNMLWGGTGLLALEHVWHGEIVARPPFLTAMQNPADIAPMLREVATVGVAMAVCVTIVWAIMVLVVELKARALTATGENAVSGGEQ